MVKFIGLNEDTKMMEWMNETLGIKEPKGVKGKDFFIPKAPEVFEDALSYHVHYDPMIRMLHCRLKFGFQKDFGVAEEMIFTEQNPDMIVKDNLLMNKKVLTDVIIKMAIELIMREQYPTPSYEGLNIVINPEIPEDVIMVHPSRASMIYNSTINGPGW